MLRFNQSVNGCPTTPCVRQSHASPTSTVLPACSPATGLTHTHTHIRTHSPRTQLREACSCALLLRGTHMNGEHAEPPRAACRPARMTGRPTQSARVPPPLDSTRRSERTPSERQPSRCLVIHTPTPIHTHTLSAWCCVSTVHHARAIKTRSIPRGPSPGRHSMRSTQHTLITPPPGSQSVHNPASIRRPYMLSLAWWEPARRWLR